MCKALRFVGTLLVGMGDGAMGAGGTSDVFCWVGGNWSMEPGLIAAWLTMASGWGCVGVGAEGVMGAGTPRAGVALDDIDASGVHD